MKINGSSRHARPERLTFPLNFSIALSLFFILGFVAYANTFQSAFHFDDYTSILNAKSIRQYTNLSALWQGQKVRFVAYLTFAWNYRFGGFQPFSYHLMNWVIHLLNGIVVFLLVRMMDSEIAGGVENGRRSETMWLAWMGAAIFLLHPLQTAGVTYVVQRIASLASLFFTAAILFYGLSRKGVLSWKWGYPFFTLSFLLALFSKENTISLPAAICAFEVCLVTKEDRQRAGLKHFWITLGASFLVSLMFYVTVYFKGISEQGALVSVITRESTALLGRREYFLTQLTVIPHYLRLSILPFGQNADYDWPIAKSLLEPRTLAGGAVLLTFLMSGFICLKRGARAAAFFIFWFFITLSVESSFIPIADVIVEHRMYLPMVGIAGLFAILLRQVVRRFGQPLMFLAVIAVTLTVLTYRRNEVWKTEYSYEEDIIKKSPRKARAYANLATTYGNDGQIDKALELFQKAIELDPRDTSARMNHGQAYQVKQMWQEALGDYLKVIGLDPGQGVPYREAGTCYLRLSNLQKAEEYLRRAVELGPEDPVAHIGLAEVYKTQEMFDKAVPLLIKTVGLITNEKIQQGEIIHRTEFNLAAIWLGGIYMSQRKYDLALESFDLVTSVDPRISLAYQGKAVAYAELGQWDGVMAQVAVLKQLNQTEALESLRGQLSEIRRRNKPAVAVPAGGEAVGLLKKPVKSAVPA